MRGQTILRRFSSLDRIVGGFGFCAGAQVGIGRLTGNCFSTGNARCTEFPPNSSIVPNVINNRNPRNLEKLRIGEKPSGWILERESKSFWNKVTLEISSRHISAGIVHYLGQTPVTVSTKEWCLKKYLYSTNDASAAKLVGEVLAQRCLQAGITEVACFFPEEERSKEKVSTFLSAMENGGVSLTEASQVLTDDWLHHYALPETPWDVHEDVDDRFNLSAKLRGFTVRRHPTFRRKGLPRERKAAKPWVWS